MAEPLPAMILLAVLAECGGPAAARTYLAARQGPRADAALRLLDEYERSADLTVSVLRQVSGERHSDMPSLSPGDWAARFDRAVAISPEASVALYSLADPLRLAAATDEVVGLMAGYGLLDQRSAVLEIGCGIGRFAAALSPSVARYDGIDVSPGMIDTARARCADLANVALQVTGGRDLAPFASGSVDLVLAIDVFPYLVAGGDGLAAAMVAEAARVLRAGGALLVMNYSYDDLDSDRVSVAKAARSAGLALVRDGVRDTEIWDGVTFLLRKPS